MCLAVPGKILSITNADTVFRIGRVSFGGVLREVSLAYVPDAVVGNYVLVHAGFAISTVDETEAARIFEYLDEIGDIEDIKTSSRTPGETDTP